MAVCERDDRAVGAEPVQPGDGVGGEARLGLLSVDEDRAAESLQACDGVGDGLGLPCGQLGVAGAAFGVTGERGQQSGGSGDAADRFGRNAHEASLDNDLCFINHRSRPPACQRWGRVGCGLSPVVVLVMAQRSWSRQAPSMNSRSGERPS